MASVDICGYCRKEEYKWTSVLCYKCEACRIYVHYDCIKSKQPSPLLGDAFFTFRCQSCGENGLEEFDRVNISWRNAVMLALYNLHKTSHGKCGFYHWKAHISAFIHSHWLVLFGQNRKQTSLWMGTIAGTLSAGCPDVFESGANLLEQGYWRLVDTEPPLMNAQKKVQYSQRKRNVESPIEFVTDRRRRAKSNALNAAIELKEKREALMEKRKRKGSKNSTITSETRKDDDGIITQQCDRSLPDAEDSMSSSCSIKEEGVYSIEETEACLVINQNEQGSSSTQLSNESSIFKGKMSTLSYKSLGLSLGGDDDSDADDDLDIDVDIESIPVTSDQFVDIRATSPEIGMLVPSDEIKLELTTPAFEIGEAIASDTESEGQSEKDIQEEMEENCAGDKDDNSIDNDEQKEEEEDDDDDGDTDSADDGFEEPIENENTSDFGEGKFKTGEHNQTKRKKAGRPRKRRRLDDPQPASSPERLQHISVFEEKELLQNLNLSAENGTLSPELTVLRRKLICNQTNREYGQPVFDLDAQVEKSMKSLRSDNMQKDVHQSLGPAIPKLPTKAANSKETRDLDRFMMKDTGKRKEREYTSFRQRLVGLKDNELRPIVSPYTTRVLVPFIWRNRNMERKPLKMRLLEEIHAYSHRNDPSWTLPQSSSIDYCYVRPEHIPSVNALSREFFWPGIDMSECLQYPDFSCVVLYKKIVIAFAFMVPDRGYNEAYISFIFTHPEWRGVGIASFMLYHLIQTCMGKDVVLHVSASNTAMLLYQKFGFKAEELSLNFYHKYFPSDCTDSCHAFLMRLTR